ncbi:MAG: nucleotidyl transferase AbiEii/AbiGii toxin family protein [Bacteroidaceae bacterium]|nr:nucleotidyl transferase AbiEii/AbiGii toxin family protein [Bacteroidaceae bacterium]
MEQHLSLAPHTGKIFEAISRLECIKPFTLVGGTALSLQIAKRQSEDLDFMKWLSSKKDKAEVDWPIIKSELETIGEIKSFDVMGFDNVSFNFEGVKLSFYAAPRTMIPSMKRIHYVNNLYLADMESIGVMKMEAMLRRAKFRDYYDVYSILQEGCNIEPMMQSAIEHSGYKLKLRGLLAMLTNGALFRKEQDFELLQPVYNVSSGDIQEYIKEKLFECQDEKLRNILKNS